MLRIKDIMTREVITATPDTTLRDAMEMLSKRHVSGAPVLDGGKVVGIFSASDLLTYLADLNDTTPSLTFRRRRGRPTPLEDATVDDVMTRHVESVDPERTVEDAAILMGTKQIHRVLVMADGVLLGIVSTSDVAKAVADHRLNTRTFVFA